MKISIRIILIFILLIGILLAFTACTDDFDTKKEQETAACKYTAKEKALIEKIPWYSEDYGQLCPIENVDKSFLLEDEILHFADKTKITGTKFGFRKKIVFDEPVVLRQYMEADRYFFYYGLYQDERLEKPVIEVDTKYNSDAFAKMEEGADKKDFPEYREGYTAKVSPGIYYLGVYTGDPSLTEGISYQCEIVPYQEEGKLLPDRSQFYTLVDEKDSVLFKIEPDLHRIEILADVWKGTVQLLDGEKQAISDPVMLKKSASENPVFTVEPGKTYYLRIRHSDVVIDSSTVIGQWRIKYKELD